MKTTIEIPDVTFRRVKAFAAARGITMRRFFTEAVEQQLRRGAVGVRDAEPSRDASVDTSVEPPWMAGFGRLSDLGDDHRLVLDAIEEEFEKLTPDDVP
ncbi:MAG: hypothetical protein OXP28_09675 [Gammaproteobacteria bacterium]|nr:hypothetical protein [Gammaproteobacteria bacterium]